MITEPPIFDMLSLPLNKVGYINSLYIFLSLDSYMYIQGNPYHLFLPHLGILFN